MNTAVLLQVVLVSVLINTLTLLARDLLGYRQARLDYAAAMLAYLKDQIVNPQPIEPQFDWKLFWSTAALGVASGLLSALTTAGVVSASGAVVPTTQPL